MVARLAGLSRGPASRLFRRPNTGQTACSCRIDSEAGDGVEIQMPAMGESVTEGTVLEWHVSEGDSVAEGDTVVEVSTDKVDAEVPAPADGTISKLLVSRRRRCRGRRRARRARAGRGRIGATAPQPAAKESRPTSRRARHPPRSRSDGAAPRPPRATTRASPPATPPDDGALQVVMPEMGESVTEGTVLEWRVAEGDSINEGDTIVEVSTDKVDAEVPAPTSGTVTKLHAEVDETIDVGAVLAEIEAGEGAAPAKAATDGGAADRGERSPPATAPRTSRARPPRSPAGSPPSERRRPELGQRLGPRRQGHQGGRPRRSKRRRSGRRARRRRRRARRSRCAAPPRCSPTR